jgi:hypothetical protein
VGTQYIKTGFIATYCRAADLELTVATLGEHELASAELESGGSTR